MKKADFPIRKPISILISLGLLLLVGCSKPDKTGYSEKEPEKEMGNEYWDEVQQETAEQKFQKEKNRLLSEGWEEAILQNGQMPTCYNLKPQKSSIDNYLEVHVGGGTDVVIKLMNSKTNKCVRYCFINSGSTYRIEGIPQGRYFLKIAYGKDWISKVENRQCVGKFLSNPLYEKGEEEMDFTFKQTADGYSIPSFQLSLDVVASEINSTFSSTDISEDAFNQ